MQLLITVTAADNHLKEEELLVVVEEIASDDFAYLSGSEAEVSISSIQIVRE